VSEHQSKSRDQELRRLEFNQIDGNVNKTVVFAEPKKLATLHEGNSIHSELTEFQPRRETDFDATCRDIEPGVSRIIREEHNASAMSAELTFDTALRIDRNIPLDTDDPELRRDRHKDYFNIQNVDESSVSNSRFHLNLNQIQNPEKDGNVGEGSQAKNLQDITIDLDLTDRDVCARANDQLNCKRGNYFKQDAIPASKLITTSYNHGRRQKDHFRNRSTTTVTPRCEDYYLDKIKELNALNIVYKDRIQLLEKRLAELGDPLVTNQANKKSLTPREVIEHDSNASTIMEESSKIPSSNALLAKSDNQIQSRSFQSMNLIMPRGTRAEVIRQMERVDIQITGLTEFFSTVDLRGHPSDLTQDCLKYMKTPRGLTKCGRGGHTTFQKFQLKADVDSLILELKRAGNSHQSIQKEIGDFLKNTKLVSCKESPGSGNSQAISEKVYCSMAKIRHIVYGQETNRFKKARSKGFSKYLSFSIVYQQEGGLGLVKTLDIVCNTREEFDHWVIGLKLLVNLRERGYISLEGNLQTQLMAILKHSFKADELNMQSLCENCDHRKNFIFCRDCKKFLCYSCDDKLHADDESHRRFDLLEEDNPMTPMGTNRASISALY